MSLSFREKTEHGDITPDQIVANPARRINDDICNELTDYCNSQQGNTYIIDHVERIDVGRYYDRQEDLTEEMNDVWGENLFLIDGEGLDARDCREILEGSQKFEILGGPLGGKHRDIAKIIHSLEEQSTERVNYEIVSPLTVDRPYTDGEYFNDAETNTVEGIIHYGEMRDRMNFLGLDKGNVEVR